MNVPFSTQTQTQTQTQGLLSFLSNPLQVQHHSIGKVKATDKGTDIDIDIDIETKQNELWKEYLSFQLKSLIQKQKYNRSHLYVNSTVHEDEDGDGSHSHSHSHGHSDSEIDLNKLITLIQSTVKT